MEEWKKSALESGGSSPGSDPSVTMGCTGEATAREKELPEAGPGRSTTLPLTSGTKKVLEFNYTGLIENILGCCHMLTLENILLTKIKGNKGRYHMIPLR